MTTTPTPAAVLAATIRNDIRTLALGANIDAPIFARLFSELNQLREMAEGAQGEAVAEVGDLIIDVRERVMRSGLKNRDALYVEAALRPRTP